MKVRELILELMNVSNLDDAVEIYVCAKADVMKDYVSTAENDDAEYALDEILQIDEVEDRGGIIWLRAEEIV